MKTSQVLSAIENKLDELILNSNELREEKSILHDLKQERLINDLIDLSNSLDEKEKHQLLQKSPRTYSALEQKIYDFSRLNRRRLKTTKYVKQARVHRKKSIQG